MGNYMTPVAREQVPTTKKMTYESNNNTAIPKNYNIHNKMRQADRYSRNGSNRGNGIRSS